MAPRSWLVGLVALVGASTARAQSPSIPVRLELTAPPGCASASRLMDALQRRNGRLDVAAAGEGAVTIRMALSTTQGGVQGRLALSLEDGSSSQRIVEGSSCQAVVELLSLKAALALAGAHPNPAAPPTYATGTRAVSAAPRLPGVTVSNISNLAEPRSRLAVEGGAQAALGQMVAPHLNVGGGLLGRARLERSSSISPSVTVSLMHTRNDLFESSRYADLRLTGVSITACPLSWRPHARMRIEPCLTGTGAELEAQGRELVSPRMVSRSWWGAGGLARLSVSPLRNLAIEVEGGGLWPLVNRRFVVSPSGQSVAHTPALAPIATAGLVYAL
jgi:hypothetical protein